MIVSFVVRIFPNIVGTDIYIFSLVFFMFLFCIYDVTGRDPLVKPVTVSTPFHINFFDPVASSTSQIFFDEIHVLIGLLKLLFVKRCDYRLALQIRQFIGNGILRKYLTDYKESFGKSGLETLFKCTLFPADSNNIPDFKGRLSWRVKFKMQQVEH